MEHSILAPSSAARRVACPGSRAMEQKYPQEDTDESREGHAAHWVLSQFLSNTNIKFLTLGALTPEGEIITQEMLDGAKLFVAHVHQIIKDPVHLHIEEKIDIASIHPACYGTPDVWYFDSSTGNLHLWDYKFGHGYVEVFENWQLIEYVAGILRDKLLIKGDHDQHIYVHFHIIQPRNFNRAGPIRTWTALASKLRPYFNQLEAAEHKAIQPFTTCIPSLECKNCTARHACPALQQTCLNLLDVQTQNIPLELPPEALGYLLQQLHRTLKLLESLATGLESQALSLIMNGVVVPGYTASPSKGRVEWKEPAETIIAVGTLLGFDLAKPISAITPLQALAKGMPQNLINNYSESKSGSLQLEEINLKTTQKIFWGKK